MGRIERVGHNETRQSQPAKVEDHLLRVLGTVRVDDRKHIAVHGTSLEAVKHMIRTGFLPGLRDARHHYEPGDISVYPTLSAFFSIARSPDAGLTHAIREMFEFPDEAQEIVEGYANVIARDHGFLTYLDFPITEENRELSEGAVDCDGFDEYLLEEGRTQEQIAEAKRIGLRRKGFLLGISPNFRREGSFVQGDSLMGDVAIRTKNRGLRYNRISGIQPLGEDEREFFSDLLRRQTNHLMRAS